MTAYVQPCADPDNNPDDWFIGRDGKQYPDDDLVSHEEAQAIGDAVIAETGDGEGVFERIDKAVDRAENDARREALGRRRRAKQACTECYLRTQCLDLAIRTEPMHGTWGGYYEEELREIRREIARRKRARGGS